MASTVRNLTVNEAFEIALKIASEYSIRGSLQTGTKIADNDAKKFSFADSAQQEIAVAIPIEDKFEISHFKTTTLFGDEHGLDFVKHVNDDVVLMATTGALSYILSSNSNSGTFTIEEETSEDVWSVLDTETYSSADEDFVTYSGHITAGDTDNSIRIVLKGSYPYQVTNYTMYDITFNGDSNIPNYGEGIIYSLPSDFRKMRKVTHNSIITDRYEIIGDNEYVILDKDNEGVYLFEYDRIPKVIDDDSGDDYEFEIKKEAQHLIPYYIAALMIVEDKPEVADVAFQEYEKKFNLLTFKKEPKKISRVANNLWGVKQYG